MPYEVFVGDREGLENRLNGALTLGPLQHRGLPVGGLTLIFTNPVATVTFSGSAGALHTVEEIAAEIQAAVAGSVVRQRKYDNGTMYSGLPDPRLMVKLWIQRDGGVGIDKDGTANPVLHISTAADISSLGVVNPPDIVAITPGSTPGHYLLVLAP